MNQNKLKVAVTAVITLMLSLYLGIGAASAQAEVLKVTGSSNDDCYLGRVWPPGLVARSAHDVIEPFVSAGCRGNGVLLTWLI